MLNLFSVFLSPLGLRAKGEGARGLEHEGLSIPPSIVIQYFQCLSLFCYLAQAPHTLTYWFPGGCTKCVAAPRSCSRRNLQHMGKHGYLGRGRWGQTVLHLVGQENAKSVNAQPLNGSCDLAGLLQQYNPSKSWNWGPSRQGPAGPVTQRA